MSLVLWVALLGLGVGQVGSAYARAAAGYRGEGSFVSKGDDSSASSSDGKVAPSRQQMLSVEYRGAWGAGLLRTFTVASDGQFVWRHRQPNIGGPLRPMKTRTGAVPRHAVAALVERIESLPVPRFRVSDSPVVDLRWRAVGGEQRRERCYALQNSACLAIVRAIDRLAKQYGSPP